MSGPPRTLSAVLDAASGYLAGRDVEQPRLCCEWLAAALLGCGRLDLHLYRDRELSEKQLAAMRRGCRRLGAGEPVQYILGQWDFRGHRLGTDRRALIPRPETEQLVQLVLDCGPLWETGGPLIADVGTGSGCIAISLALERPGGRYVAMDPSREALELAMENAARHGLRDTIVFTDRDLSDGLEPGRLDALVSNPPYIPSADCDRLAPHIRDHEPRVALDGGEDGLAVIGDVIGDAGILLRPGGWIFLELGAGQGKRVTALLNGAGFTEVRLYRDAAGQERFAGAVLAA